ncbi:RETICULATA-RELATED 4, chloroplastic-like protein [Drosera capensis]
MTAKAEVSVIEVSADKKVIEELSTTNNDDRRHLPLLLRHHHHRFLSPLPTPSSIKLPLRSPSLAITTSRRNFLAFSVSGHGGESGNFGGNGGGEGGGGGGGGEGDNDSGDGDKARREVMLVLSQMGRSLESLPSDLAAAVKEGRIPAKIVMRYVELEKPPEFRWLLQFGGFRERLLADHLFLAKLGMECGVGIFTKSIEYLKVMVERESFQTTAQMQLLPAFLDVILASNHIHGFQILVFDRLIIGEFITAAEYERQREKFFNELEIVFADVPSPAIEAGPIAKFFHRCPDNAFQVALGGASYSLVQRSGAIVVSLCR